MLNGDKANNFMESQGYKLVPTQVVSYDNTYTEDFQTGPNSVHITYGEHFDYTEKVGYVPNNFIESRKSNIGNTYYGKFDGSLGHGRIPYVERQTIAYSEMSKCQRFFKSVFGAYLTIGHGMHDYVDRRTYGRYNGGNKYIDAFLDTK